MKPWDYHILADTGKTLLYKERVLNLEKCILECVHSGSGGYMVDCVLVRKTYL